MLPRKSWPLIAALAALPGWATAAEETREPGVKEPAEPAAVVGDPSKNETKAKTNIPPLDDFLEAWGIALSGYIDTSYTHLSGAGTFTNGVANRVFDVEHNSFNLQQAAITIARQPKEGFGGLVNLTAGKDANVIASFDTAPNDNGSFTGSKDFFDVTQAFAQFAKGPFTVIGGKYVTLAGAEVINSPSNVNFSRSILFGYAIPFTHTGARASYAINDWATVLAGVNNGWDVLKDTNSQKTGEVGVLLTPIKAFTLAAQGYFGEERACGAICNTGPQGERDLIDLVATYNATEQLSFVLNYDYGRQDNVSTVTPNNSDVAKWSGVAGYANYQISDQWRVSLRGEFFDDGEGYRTGIAQQWKEGTITVGWLPYKNFELRAEGRYDRSNVASFLDTDGTADRSQTSFGLQALLKF